MAGLIEHLMVKIGADSKQAERTVKGFERAVDGAMKGVIAAGAAAGVGFAATFGQALEVEASSDLMAAQMNLTAAESERAGAIAGELYASGYGANIGEINQALRGVIAQTGELGDLTDAELTGMGQNALDLAQILETDVTRVVQVAGQAVRNGLADNADEAFDLIAAASAKTMPGLTDDLLDAADEYGVFFAQLGLEGEEAFGILAAGSQQGMYGIDKAGDALKEFTIRAVDMSKSSTDAFEAIGLDADDMAADILAGGETARGAFDEIIAGLLDMKDPVEQQTAAIALFGTPLEDLSTAQIPEFLAALDTGESGLGDFAGAADDAGDQLSGNANRALTELGRTIQTEFVGAITPALPLVQKFAGILIPFAPVLLGVASAVVAVASAVAVYKAVMVVATAVQWLFNLALWANPITWVVLAILALIAVVVLMVVYWDDIVAKIKGGFAIIKLAAKAVADWWTGSFWPGVKSVFVNIAAAAIRAKNTIVDGFWGLIDKVKALPGKIKSAASGMFDGIKSAFKLSINWLIGKWNGLQFSVPSIDMGALGSVGGFTLSVPQIPMLAAGGNIRMGGTALVGEAGPELLDLPRGARVTPLDKAGPGGGESHVYLHLDGDEDLIRLFRRAVKNRGGNVQVVLGG